MVNSQENNIIEFVKNYPNCSSKDIFEGLKLSSYATTKRLITKLIRENLLEKSGERKGTKYKLSPAFKIISPININEYYQQEIDERQIKETFNLSLIKDVLSNVSLFTEEEKEVLNKLQATYSENILQLGESEYKKELDRLAIDLSWKSSQIEGNTYTLLETERLLKEKETASGRTKEEAIMLLNHKEAIDFIIDNPNYLSPLNISKIEDIHSLLVKDLAIDKHLRKGRVGISGTNYRPLDNEFQIREAMVDMCELINKKQDVFEKSLLALVLISYIQPFSDGNKRAARIVSNTILINNRYCPISFRTVDSIDYKKAMLLFYEQNNIYNFKKIFINQFEFAVKTYF